jgi:hypothetical protein
LKQTLILILEASIVALWNELQWQIVAMHQRACRSIGIDVNVSSARQSGGASCGVRARSMEGAEALHVVANPRNHA